MKTPPAVTMQEVMQLLRSQSYPLCFEQVAIESEKVSRSADGKIEHGLCEFPMPHVGNSIEAVLDDLIQSDPDYLWESSLDGVYTVYPRHGGVLTWLVQPFVKRKTSFLSALDQIGLQQHDISLFQRGLESLADVELDLSSLGELSARHWLGAFARKVGSDIYWNLAGFKSERSLVIGRVVEMNKSSG